MTYINSTVEETVSNGGILSLPDATSGKLFFVRVSDTADSVTDGNVQTDGSFNVSTNGTVELTDTGSTLAIYTSGTQVIIKNKYGVSKKISYKYEQFE